MLFIPKNTKFRKQQKGKNFNCIIKPKGLNNLKHGSIALKALDAGRISSNHISACKQVINKILKKTGQVKINMIADTPISKKPIEVRMGKGKGLVDHWIFKVSPGFILFEIEANTKILAIKALKAAQLKLPINTKILED